MLKIWTNGFEKKDLLKELINEFIPSTEYDFISSLESDEIIENTADENNVIKTNLSGRNDVNEIKRELFDYLSGLTKDSPSWGILTGVRPVKLAGELIEKEGVESAIKILEEYYYLSPEKARLITGIYENQIASLGKPERDTVSLYIGIPFCPTRCLYCSFASNQEDYSEIKRYIHALYKELDYVGEELKKAGIYPESIYIGGGTPTTLNCEDLSELMGRVKSNFDLTRLREYTVEAGRPDTINSEKLSVIKENGGERISINPQSMIDRTMDLIGRSHRPEEIKRAYEDAENIGFESINMDIIAGLPEETLSDFMFTLSQVYELGPDNITIHSLSVKRASRLREEQPEFYRTRSMLVRDMLKEGELFLTEKGYIPYYLYRQKYMAGSAENTGYAIPGKEGLYNVRIMDEHQTNIALGAGGISKIYFPDENRLERVANVTNYRQYIERIDEMIDRKRKDLFNAYKRT